MNVRESIALLLTREIDGFIREVELFPDDASLWKTLPGVSNSAGNLALHLAGNLQHFIGAVLGETGYRRNRDLEFSRRDGKRTEVVAELNQAAIAVRNVMATFPEDRLNEPFPELMMGKAVNTGEFLLHLCAHAGFHLGQAGYLRRVAMQDPRSSGPLPIAPLTRT